MIQVMWKVNFNQFKYVELLVYLEIVYELCYFYAIRGLLFLLTL